MRLANAFLGVSLLCGVFCAGLAVADIDHRRDDRTFHKGWDAGYSAREAVAQETDKRLVVGGLCVYASLACGGKHK